MLRRLFGGGSSRVSRRDAERLLDSGRALDGGPAGAGHDGLANLLAAAAAPARPDELAGEAAAVAAFRREFRRRPGRAPAVRPYRRRIAVVGALSAAVLAVGGTAYAASTGRLPDPVQRVVDGVFTGGSGGRPHGGATPATSADPASRVPGTGASPPGPASATNPADRSPGPDEARMTGLCRSWEASRDNPHSAAISADDLRILAAAAGGEDRIAAYCAEIRSTGPKPTKSDKPGNSNPGGGRPTAPPGGGRTKK